MDLFEEYDAQELLLIDIQYLGLKQQPWTLKRGARLERIYTDENDIVTVRDFYTYAVSDMRSVTPLKRTIEWLHVDGSVGQSKETTLTYSDKALKEVNRAVRQGRIDYLESSAEKFRDVAETLPEPHKTQYMTIADSIDLLFNHYEVQVDHYVKRGTLEFEEAVINETNPTILAILAIPTKEPDADFPNGLTVKTSILYQLNGDIP